MIRGNEYSHLPHAAAVAQMRAVSILHQLRPRAAPSCPPEPPRRPVCHQFSRCDGCPYTELDLPARPWVLLDALDKVRYREGDGLSLEVDTYYDCQELEPHLSADPLSLMELNDLAVRLSEMSDT